MILVNWNETIDSKGRVIPMKKVKKYAYQSPNEYMSEYVFTRVGFGEVEKKENPKYKPPKIKWEIPLHSCVICSKDITKDKKLIPYEIGAGRKYAHSYCWYKSVKHRRDKFLKADEQYKQLLEKYPRELLMGQLKDDEQSR